MGVALETLGRHHRAIALAWWASFLSGPFLFALIVAAVRGRRTRRDLRWVVDMPKEAS